MKLKILLALCLLAMVIVGFVGYKNFGKGNDAIAPKSLGNVGQSEIERGKYLATAADCVACHSKKGAPAFSGGEPLFTPFGKITGGNITPDVESGIGSWSDEDFLQAVKHGRAKGGVFLYPAMPYPNFAKASDADILAIKAYLDTLPPIKSKPPVNELAFPFNIRMLVMGWNTLFYDKNGFQPNPQQSDEWNRGAYLVEGLAHCGMCHTPKNILGADKKSATFQGASLQGWYAPELTSNNYSGLGNWNKAEIVEYLKTGNSRHAFASGPMAEAVENSLQYLNNEDISAMVTYLQSQPPSNRKAPDGIIALGDVKMNKGEKIFAAHCSACHGVQAEGTQNIAPAFTMSPSVRAPDVTNMVTIILNGTRAAATNFKPTAPAMPSFRQVLSDSDVASVITYIRNSFGNRAEVVDSSVVTKIRTIPLPHAKEVQND